MAVALAAPRGSGQLATVARANHIPPVGTRGGIHFGGGA